MTHGWVFTLWFLYKKNNFPVIVENLLVNEQQ
jgi:hypothetical protein